MNNEKKFREELEIILGMKKGIKVHIIGKPYIEAKWLVSLKIATMIIDYNKIKLNKEVEISFIFSPEEFLPTINKMKSYDIHTIEIPFEAMTSLMKHKKAKQKNFIYVSDEGLSENKNLEGFMKIEAISRIGAKLKCNILVREEKKEIEFSNPPNNLIKKYHKAKQNAYIKNMKKEIQKCHF